jgi:cyanophycin synthetase
VSAPGDRRDEDIQEIALIAGRTFDHIIFRRDDDRRGRGADEVPNLMAAALADAGIPTDRYQVIVDEVAAVGAALELARPGDLLTVFGDNITRTWKQIIYFDNPESEGSAAPDEALHEPLTGAEEPAPFVEVVERHLDGAVIIADERGVRLARETDDSCAWTPRAG